MPEREYILITGAAGFLGSWLAEAAHERGLGVIGLDKNQPRRPEIFSAFAQGTSEQVDFAALVGTRQLQSVFHLAGGASVPQSVENPVGDFASLLPGTIGLIDYLARHQRETHLIFFSSAAVYGNPSLLPVAETAPISPISPYGVHKAMAEFAIEHYARIYGLRSSILRIFSAYGEELRKQVVWDISRKVMEASDKGEKFLPMHGTGKETRDFIHASDIARAALLVAAHPPKSGAQIFNASSGVEVSIRTLGEKLLLELHCDVELDFNGVTRPGDPMNWRADITKLHALGFKPALSLDEGIARFVRWQKSIPIG